MLQNKFGSEALETIKTVIERRLPLETVSLKADVNLFLLTLYRIW